MNLRDCMTTVVIVLIVCLLFGYVCSKNCGSHNYQLCLDKKATSVDVECVQP